jgi:hypothetical protein
LNVNKPDRGLWSVERIGGKSENLPVKATRFLGGFEERAVEERA